MTTRQKKLTVSGIAFLQEVKRADGQAQGTNRVQPIDTPNYITNNPLSQFDAKLSAKIDELIDQEDRLAEAIDTEGDLTHFLDRIKRLNEIYQCRAELETLIPKEQ